MAGCIGVDPGPLSLRELLWMFEGACREHWGHTSNLMALIANANRDPKKGKPFKATDFNLYHDKRKAAIIADTKENIEFMRQMFTGMANGKQ
jgi:hypothetical protein